MNTKVFKLSILLLGLLILAVAIGTRFKTVSAEPAGFITFENGIDGSVISSSIPGLEFTNTSGYDWLYLDCSTGNYNCPYPNGAYTVNGNIGAWLGTDQGDGRIDFTSGGATYLSIWVSAGEPVQLTAYYYDGQVADFVSMEPNLNTGQMTNLRVDAPPGDVFQYAIISGVGNYWAMDDLSTDADGVPNERNPLIFVPGITGSKLENDHNGDGTFDEIWPNIDELVVDPDDDSLLVLRLASNGLLPYSNEQSYTSVRVGDIIREEWGIDFYKSTIDYYTNNGYTEGKDFFVCPYDWRRGVDQISDGTLNETLDKCVDKALAANLNATKVNILAHSMGGLVSRYYISDPARSQRIQRLVTLGTPYLGAPKVALTIIDELCFVEKAGICFTSPATLKKLLVNFPSTYQLAPSDDFFRVYPKGYIRVDRDTNGNGSNKGYLDVGESFSRLGVDNWLLAQNARSLLLTIGGWNNGGTNGVDVFMMVGDGFDSVGTIVEYNKTPWYNPWGTEVAYRIEPTNGDGTVPLRSADTRNLSDGVNLSDDATVYYFHLKHDELATDYEVLQFAGAIFASASTENITLHDYTSGHRNSSQSNVLMPSNTTSPQPNLPLETPRTTPIPLDGRFITLDGPARVEIFDSLGNRIGSINNGGGYEVSIPGASLYEFGGGISVFLPDSGLYDINVYGEQEAETDVRIQKIVSDQLTQTALYDALPLTASSVASLEYSPNTVVPGAFDLDQNGDGISEAPFPYTKILDPLESQDVEAPKTTITISGTRSSDGWYVGEATVTMIAVDNTDGTGVAKIEYSLDNGSTKQTYSRPFIINADEVRTIFAKAIDESGNEESPLSFLGSLRTYLPMVGR